MQSDTAIDFLWLKETSKQIEQYKLCLNNKLRAINQMSSEYVCTDLYCTNMEHTNEIDLLCNCIIESCVASGLHWLGHVADNNNIISI